MKKNKFLLSFLVFVISCLNFNAAAESYEDVIKYAADNITSKAMKKISPITGENGWYRIDTSSMRRNGNTLSAEVTIGWQEWNLFTGERQCQLWGTLYVNLATGALHLDPSSMNSDMEAAIKDKAAMEEITLYGIRSLLGSE